MARYHFNVYDGYDRLDSQGTEIATWQLARTEAIRLTGDILFYEADRLLLGEGWRMEITDSANAILFRLDLSYQELSAAQSAEPRADPNLD